MAMARSWTPLFLGLSMLAILACSFPAGATAQDQPYEGDKHVATAGHLDQLLDIISYEHHLPEVWVGRTTKATKTCGIYVNGKKTKCTQSFRFCRKRKCVTLLAIILPIIGGILIFLLVLIVVCCCCATAITALCCCGGSREVKTEEYPPQGYQVNGQPAPVQV